MISLTEDANTVWITHWATNNMRSFLCVLLCICFLSLEKIQKIFKDRNMFHVCCLIVTIWGWHTSWGHLPWSSLSPWLGQELEDPKERDYKIDQKSHRSALCYIEDWILCQTIVLKAKCMEIRPHISLKSLSYHLKYQEVGLTNFLLDLKKEELHLFWGGDGKLTCQGPESLLSNSSPTGKVWGIPVTLGV